MISKIGIQDELKLVQNFKKDQGSKILSGMNSSSNELKFLICHLQTYKKEIWKNDGLIFSLKKIFWVYVSYTHGLEDYQNGDSCFEKRYLIMILIFFLDCFDPKWWLYGFIPKSKSVHRFIEK